MSPDKKRYDLVYSDELLKISKLRSILAVLVGGSYAKNEISKGSDLDFILITKNGDSVKEERHTNKGISVEYFFIPEKIIDRELSRERKNVNRLTTGLLAESKYVQGNKLISEKLIRKAKKVHTSQVPKLSASERAAFMFFLGRSPEQEDRILRRGQNLAGKLRMNHKLYVCFELAHRLERIAVPSCKQWDDDLSHLSDRKMAALLKKAILAEKNEYQKNWARLVAYTFDLLKKNK